MTGNPSYGLAKAFNVLVPNVSFHSRQCGIRSDLSKEENQKKFSETTLDYDIFINNSYISHFTQLNLSRNVWTLWKKNKKSGFIINIGSSVRDLLRPDNRFYPTSKRALEDYTRQLYLHSIWGNSMIRVTCLSFGGIATEGTLAKWSHYNHMSSDYCASVLKWVVDAPKEINVDLLQISPIQPKSKSEMKKSESKSTLTSPSDFLIADFDDGDL